MIYWLNYSNIFPLFQQAHTNSCEFVKLPCVHPECGMLVKKADLPQHLETECKCRPETCGFCKTQISLNKLKVWGLVLFIVLKNMPSLKYIVILSIQTCTRFGLTVSVQGFFFTFSNRHFYMDTNRVPKCDFIQNEICEIMGFVKIFWKNNVQDAYSPKISNLGQIVSEILVIIYTKKLLNPDWLRKECSSSVTRVQNV